MVLRSLLKNGCDFVVLIEIKLFRFSMVLDYFLELVEMFSCKK